MSQVDDEPKDTRYFRESYPVEHQLSLLITKEIEKAFQDILKFSDIKAGQTRDVVLLAAKSDDGQIRFAYNSVGIVFLGVLTRAILSIVTSMKAEPSRQTEDVIKEKAKEAAREYVMSVNPHLLNDIKRCNNYGLDNDYDSNFCKKCGNRIS